MSDEFDSRSRLISTQPVICERCVAQECSVWNGFVKGSLDPVPCLCGCHKRSVEGVF